MCSSEAVSSDTRLCQTKLCCAHAECVFVCVLGCTVPSRPPVLLCKQADGFIDTDIHLRADLGRAHIHSVICEYLANTSSRVRCGELSFAASQVGRLYTRTKQRGRRLLFVCVMIRQELQHFQSLNSQLWFCC